MIHTQCPQVTRKCLEIAAVPPLLYLFLPCFAPKHHLRLFLDGLVSRTSVLAAANPIYGRYDDLKSAAENIDLMTTILSRFDLIFIVRDIR